MDAPRIAALSRLFAANMRQRGYRKATVQDGITSMNGRYTVVMDAKPAKGKARSLHLDGEQIDWSRTDEQLVGEWRHLIELVCEPGVPTCM